jgi:PST family polysaccharide transporter
MSPSVPAPPATLARAASGYRAALLSHAVRVLCKFAGVVVLARLVSPAGHGHFAMAAAAYFFLTLFRDLGTTTAAIQAPALDEGRMTALWRLNAALGLLLAAVAFAAAPAVAAGFAAPAVAPLLRAMSLGFVLAGLNAGPRTLLARELRFAELNRLETAGAVAGTAAMLAAAALGAGAQAFVAFLLVSETVMLAAAWRTCRWRPRAPADWAGLRGLLRTGLPLTGTQLLQFGQQQLDTVLLGRWFGASPLGHYNRAGQLLVQPATHLAAPFCQILLATLSRLGPAAPAFAAHLRATAGTIAHLTLPVAAVCFALPAEIVHLLLGPGWPDAAPLLVWLAVSAAASFLTATVHPVCVAAGHASRLVALAALALPVTLLGLWLGRDHGPAGLAAGLAAANLALLFPRLWAATRGTSVRLRDYAGAFAGPLAVAAGLVAGLRAGRAAAEAHSLGLRLLAAAVGGALAVGLLVALSGRLRREARALRDHLPFARSAAP